MRVLIVEDEPTLAMQLAEALGSAGYAVDHASNGLDACIKATMLVSRLMPLFSISGLPQMDGISVLKKWRAAGRSMPVLILTARDNWHSEGNGDRCGR